MATCLNRTTLDPGQVIFRPGDPSGQYYVVIEGEVEVRGEGSGADQTVTRVRPSEMFGDQAALRGPAGRPHCACRHTRRPLAVEREAMRDLLLPRGGE